MPTRGSKDPNGRALRGRRAHTTFALLTDPARQIWNSFNNRANAGGADAPEAAVNGCLYDRFKSLYTKTATKPSLVIVPARFKSGTLYSQIPSSNADFTVTRALNTATRFDSSALIQAGITSGVPRLDYYTSGGVTGCPALLVEPSGTNLAFQSAGFQVSGTWAPTNIAVTTGTTSAFTAPDNSTDADLLADDTTNGRHRVQQNLLSFTSGTTYTFSVFVKKNSSNRFLLINADTAFNSRAVLSLDTLAITNIGGSGASVENYGNGWYRFSIRGTASATTAGGTVFVQMQDTNADGTYIGNGSSFYLWGAQLETGSVATSYIPTTAVTGSRSADVISVSGAVSGSIGQTEGTFYFDFQASPSGASSNWLNISDGTTNNWLFIGKDNTKCRAYIRASNSVILSDTSFTLTGSSIKAALAYKSGDYAFYINGNLIASGTTAFTFSAGLSRIHSGAETPLAVGEISRYRAAALYTTRLTNAELALITQP